MVDVTSSFFDVAPDGVDSVFFFNFKTNMGKLNPKNYFYFKSFLLYNEKSIDIYKLFWYDIFRGDLYDIKT